MSQNDDTIDELIDRWEELRAAGRDISAEELCREWPELLGEVRRQIESLRWLPSPDPIDEPADALTSFSARDSGGKIVPQEPVPSQLGRYRLDSPIGAGGFGQVWKAFDTQLKRYVAIKIPRAQRLTDVGRHGQFLEEAQKLAQLRHANIVPVYDVGKHEGWFYIVTELVDGESLADRLARGPLGWSEAVRIATAVADALHDAHEQGFIHRDVKPANILLDRSDRVFLTDFGIAVTHEQLAEEKDSTSGTLAYMSPEQIRGEGGKIDRHTDIYSLGVVLYEATAGRRPFNSTSPGKLRTEILGGLIAPLSELVPEIPPALDSACRRALSESPDDRFSDAASFATAIRQAAVGSEQGASKRRRLVGIATACVAALIIAAITWPFLPRGAVVDEGGENQDGRGNAEKVAVTSTVIGDSGPEARNSARLDKARAAGSPVAWYTFDDPEDRTANNGTGDRGHRVTIQGNIEFTDSGDIDAPPASLGTGIRFRDSYQEKLLADKTLLFGQQWTISLWFRQAVQVPKDNLDYLIFIGRLDGMGGGSPELNVMMSGDTLVVLNYPSLKTTDYLYQAEKIRPETWHHVVLVFSGTGPATDQPGTLTVYLDGKQIAQDNVALAPVLRYGSAPLIFGSINQPYQPAMRNRAINGVLADIRIYDRALDENDVVILWRRSAEHPAAQ